jgi:hypothetical protein
VCTVSNPSIDSRCIITEAHGAALIYIPLVRMVIEFDQSLAFHLQFHLGALLESGAQTAAFSCCSLVCEKCACSGLRNSSSDGFDISPNLLV